MTELTTTITPRYIDKPTMGKSGKMGPGHIKDQNDVRYDVWTRTMPIESFQVGVPVQIAFEEKQNGQYVNREIKRILEVQTRPIPPVMGKPNVPPPRARTNPTDSEQIFVTAIIKHIATADMSRDEGKALVNLWRGIYADTFGSPQKQDSQSTYSDEIPY